MQVALANGKCRFLPWDINYIVTWKDVVSPQLGGHLCPAQMEEMQRLLQEFFQQQSRLYHRRIVIIKAMPVRLLPYQLPHATVWEHRQTERDGIIEQSSSRWAAPNVFMKDRTLRMCFD